MSKRYHFTHEGMHFRTSAADAFLLLAIDAYWPGQASVPGQRERANKILERAAAAGFDQADNLVTLLSNRELSHRTIRLAEEVTADVGGAGAMITMLKDSELGKAGAA